MPTPSMTSRYNPLSERFAEDQLATAGFFLSKPKPPDWPTLTLDRVPPLRREHQRAHQRKSSHCIGLSGAYMLNFGSSGVPSVGRCSFHW